MSSLPSLLEWSSRPERLLYFGDFDAAGLAVLEELGVAHLRWPGIPRVEPARELYALLVERGSALGARLYGEPCAPKRAAALARTLPEPLDVLARSCLDRGARWPQELVTEVELRCFLEEGLESGARVEHVEQRVGIETP